MTGFSHWGCMLFVLFMGITQLPYSSSINDGEEGGEQCTETSMEMGIVLEGLTESSDKILATFQDKNTVEDCKAECCARRADRCNVVSFLDYQGTKHCYNIRCEPFTSCIWEKYPGAEALKIEWVNATENSESTTTETSEVTSTQSGATTPGSSATQAAATTNTQQPTQSETNPIPTASPTTTTTTTTTPLLTTTPIPAQTPHIPAQAAENKKPNASATGNDSATPSSFNKKFDGPFGYQVDAQTIAIATCATVVILLVMLIVFVRKVTMVRERAQYRPLRESTFTTYNEFNDKDEDDGPEYS